jgi:son of sevenless-like protein
VTFTCLPLESTDINVVHLPQRCLALNNFSSVIQIIAGLNSTPIHRLRRTWEAVGQKTMIILGTLNNVMRSDKNCKEYREALRSVTPPCVPFLGSFSSFIVFASRYSTNSM